MKKNNYFFLIFFLLLTISCDPSEESKTYKVVIQFPSNIDFNKIQIHYDNGKESKFISGIDNHEYVINDSIYAKYASIEISYPRENGKLPYYYAGFFVNGNPATISFIDSNKGNPLQKNQLINAKSFNEMGMDLYKSFINEAETEFWDFYNDNLSNLGKDTSLTRTMFKKSERLTNKKIDFIIKNKDLYYSFWLFRKEIGPTEKYNSETLFNLYNKLFSNNIKKSYEGQELYKYLRGLNLKKNQNAPYFRTYTINGEKISLDDYIGSYVILNFWSSTCTPCIKEFPILRSIRDHILGPELQFIFFNQDRDSTAFNNAILEYELNFGKHIKSNQDLITLYGAQSIPQVYLINPEGNIVYSRSEEKDLDLQTLLKILDKELNIE